MMRGPFLFHPISLFEIYSMHTAFRVFPRSWFLQNLSRLAKTGCHQFGRYHETRLQVQGMFLRVEGYSLDASLIHLCPFPFLFSIPNSSCITRNKTPVVSSYFVFSPNAIYHWIMYAIRSGKAFVRSPFRPKKKWPLRKTYFLGNLCFFNQNTGIGLYFT